MKSYRFTYRSEIYVEAETPQEAWKKLQAMPIEEFKDKSDFVEWVSGEDEEYNDILAQAICNPAV